MPEDFIAICQEPTTSNEVLVQRAIDVNVEDPQVKEWFQFGWVKDANNQPSPLYQEWVYERVEPIVTTLFGTRNLQREVEFVLSEKQSDENNELLLKVAKDLSEISNSLGNRHFASVGLMNASNLSDQQWKEISARLEIFDQRLSATQESLKKSQNAEEGSYISNAHENASIIENERKAIADAKGLIRSYVNIDNKKTKASLTLAEVKNILASAPKEKSGIEPLSFQGRNPFFKGLLIDWENDRIELVLDPKVQDILSTDPKDELRSMEKEKINQLLFGEVAALQRATGEDIKPMDGSFAINMSPLPGTNSFLRMDLGQLAGVEASHLKSFINDSWIREHGDFSPSAYPVRGYQEFNQASVADKRLGLFIYAPSAEKGLPMNGFKENSIYVVARTV
jgi:hypothetical protein